MKYHVNPDTGKVSVCRAKVKCRFGGASGKENHFSSQKAADTAAEAMLSSRYATTIGKSKSGFAKVKQNIEKGLVSAGIITDLSSLPAVASEDELVEKWFKGDRKKYELVAHFSDPTTKITAATKRSFGRLVATGANVSLVGEDSFADAPSKTVSDVSLIDQAPASSPSSNELAKGASKPF